MYMIVVMMLVMMADSGNDDGDVDKIRTFRCLMFAMMNNSNKNIKNQLALVQLYKQCIVAISNNRLLY